MGCLSSPMRCCARQDRWARCRSCAWSRGFGVAGGACTARWPRGTWLPRRSGTCWWRIGRWAGRWCLRSTRRPGPAVTPSAARLGACTTTPRGTRRASRSWRAGLTSGSASWAGSTTRGPRRSTPVGFCRRPIRCRRPSSRLVRWSSGSGPRRRHGCHGDPAAGVRRRLGPDRAHLRAGRGRGAGWPCWCGSDPTACSTPTRGLLRCVNPRYAEPLACLRIRLQGRVRRRGPPPAGSPAPQPANS